MRVDLQGSSVEFKPRESVVPKIEASLQPGFEPVQPRYAATVMLVRDSKPFQTEYRIESDHFPSDFPTGQELEVFMLRRVKTMEFVPDAVVFPGGRVDERDSNPNLPWCGPTPAQWAELMGCTEEVARRVVVAAAREVFEECGVLLAGPDEHSVVQDLSDPTWKENRTALENHEIAFADFLILHGLVLRTDLLGLISNFCTPEFETKRYDTFFFSALMPEGQVADGETSEAQIAACRRCGQMAGAGTYYLQPHVRCLGAQREGIRGNAPQAYAFHVVPHQEGGRHVRAALRLPQARLASGCWGVCRMR